MIGTQYPNAEEGKCGAIAPLASPLPRVDPDAVDVMMPATWKPVEGPSEPAGALQNVNKAICRLPNVPDSLEVN